MGIGVSIFLIAVGAILTFAINVTTNGFNINTVGIILMIVGALGLITSLIVWGPRRRSSRAVTYDDGYAPTGGRRVVREESYHDTV